MRRPGLEPGLGPLDPSGLQPDAFSHSANGALKSLCRSQGSVSVRVVLSSRPFYYNTELRSVSTTSFTVEAGDMELNLTPSGG